MEPQHTLIYQPGNPRSLAVRGEIDVYTVPDLQNSLRLAVWGAHRERWSRSTCPPVSFIDARGLVAPPASPVCSRSPD